MSMINKIKGLWQDGKTDYQNITPASLPFFSIVFGPFSVLIDKFSPFLLIGLIYSLILGLVSFAFGFSYMCIYGYDTAFYCSLSNLSYIFYSLIRFALFVMFAAKFYELAYQKHRFGLKWLFSFGKKELRTMLFLLGFFAIFGFPVLSFYILYEREPNPDWVLELVFFGIVSIGFLLPLFAMRFYSILGFILQKEEVPALKTIWYKSRGNTLRIIFGMLLLSLFMILLFSAFLTNFRLASNPVSFYMGMMAEFFYNLMVMFLLVIFISHCVIQKTYLFKEEG